jgi:hypothetical protein
MYDPQQDLVIALEQTNKTSPNRIKKQQHIWKLCLPLSSQTLRLKVGLSLTQAHVGARRGTAGTVWRQSYSLLPLSSRSPQTQEKFHLFLRQRWWSGQKDGAYHTVAVI